MAYYSVFFLVASSYSVFLSFIYLETCCSYSLRLAFYRFKASSSLAILVIYWFCFSLFSCQSFSELSNSILVLSCASACVFKSAIISFKNLFSCVRSLNLFSNSSFSAASYSFKALYYWFVEICSFNAFLIFFISLSRTSMPYCSPRMAKMYDLGSWNSLAAKVWGSLLDSMADWETEEVSFSWEITEWSD